MKKPAVWSRWGSVNRQRAAAVDVSLLDEDRAKTGISAARSSRAKSGWESKKAAIRRSFSVGEMVQVE
jgi:hypothetical protein